MNRTISKRSAAIGAITLCAALAACSDNSCNSYQDRPRDQGQTCQQSHGGGGGAAGASQSASSGTARGGFGGSGEAAGAGGEGGGGHGGGGGE